jgi:hypothetical protein
MLAGRPSLIGMLVPVVEVHNLLVILLYHIGVPLSRLCGTSANFAFGANALSPYLADALEVKERYSVMRLDRPRGFVVSVPRPERSTELSPKARDEGSAERARAWSDIEAALEVKRIRLWPTCCLPV